MSYVPSPRAASSMTPDQRRSAETMLADGITPEDNELVAALVSEGPGSVEPPASLCNIEGCAYTKHEKGPHS